MEEIQEENKKVWGEDERKNPNKIITIDMNESEHKQLKAVYMLKQKNLIALNAIP